MFSHQMGQDSTCLFNKFIRVGFKLGWLTMSLSFWLDLLSDNNNNLIFLIVLLVKNRLNCILIFYMHCIPSS